MYLQYIRHIEVSLTQTYKNNCRRTHIVHTCEVEYMSDRVNLARIRLDLFLHTGSTIYSVVEHNK
jgi:hypothetical protein